MSGIDRFLSSSLSKVIKEELDSDVLKIVERKLFLEYGMSIKLSMEHFHQFRKTLEKNSRLDINKFQDDCIGKIIKIKKTDSTYTISLLDDKLSSLVLQQIGDDEGRKIITSIFEKEMVIPDILKKANVPKTSGYRKIENLILNGMIVETGRILSGSKKISKFRCCFNEVRVNIDKNNSDIIVIVDRDMFEKSTCLADS